MPFVIDDIAIAAAAEAAVETAVETAVESIEIIGDGIGEQALDMSECTEVSEISATLEQPEIVGDGIGEQALNMSECTEVSEVSTTLEQPEVIGDGIGDPSVEELGSEDTTDTYETSIDSSMNNDEIVDDGESKSVVNDRTQVNEMPNETKDVQTNIEETPRTIKTINDNLAGKTHPETGVPFVEKVVSFIRGDIFEKVKGVFPQFESVFDAQLPENMYQSPDRIQIKECNRQLKDSVETDPKLRSRFSKDQLDDIKEGLTPDGYTWHHNEEAGKMQLVDSNTHSLTRHTGGQYFWGGGTDNRH